MSAALPAPHRPRTLLWLALALVLFVYLIQSAAVWTFALRRGEEGLGTRAVIPDQIAAVLVALSETGGPERTLLLRAVNGPGFHVKVLPSWPDAELPPYSDWYFIGTNLARIIPPEKAELLAGLHIWNERASGLGFGPAELWVLARLPGGEAAQIVVSDSVVGRTALLWTVAGLGGAGVLLLVLAMIGLQRVFAPLGEIAAAAERIGAAPETAPTLPERGIGELRAVASAMNRMQQRLAQFIRERTNMLAGISHDVRTLLTRLRLRLEYLPDPAMRGKCVADIDYVIRLLDQHLDFARADAAREPPTRVDLAPLVRDLCEDAAERGEAARFAGPESLPIEGRPDALKRAIGNLIDNAIAYGGTAEVTLDAEAGLVRVSVADRGQGIPVAERETVFEPFRRATLERPDGAAPRVGLGLAIARAILRGHGGDIAIADRPGGGTIVTASLPAFGIAAPLERPA